MATIFEKYTAEEQRCVVYFLLAKGLDAKDVYKEMFPAYSGKCLSHKAVHNWVEKFCQEHSKVIDDAQSGHPVETATEATMQWVEEFIQTDRRIRWTV
jgi:transposase